MAGLSVESTTIPGLLILHLPLHADTRGWFKENWQRATMVAAGLPDFGPVQNNIAFNTHAGVTRGIHAEPWDKLVSVATGQIFGAWADLRPGPTFGRTVTVTMGPDTAVFVPRGVGNAYQTLQPATAYSYLVNDHWSPAAKASYTFVNLADPTLAIDWPISLDRAEVSDADRHHPTLDAITPMPPKKTLILGAGGQLGRALHAALPDATAYTSADFDLTNPDAYHHIHWPDIDTIINAAAYTKVDQAETPQGRRAAWAVNVSAVSRLARVAAAHNITLVHLSSDYVFDGTRTEHDEDEPVSPLGVYGQTKAAGDAIVATVPRHYLIRTSWVIGDGHNFVATIARLADQGINPTVVNDQHGRLTFTTTLTDAITHLLTTGAPYGTYNVTNTGPTHTWADIARTIYQLRGRNPNDITPTTTAQYTTGKTTAPRPQHSTLTLHKITTTGYTPPTPDHLLTTYLNHLPHTRTA